MITLKSAEDLQIMRSGGAILAQVFNAVAQWVEVGANAGAIDEKIHRLILELGGEPSFLGYQGYKYASCISKNEEVVHGIPSQEKRLYPGDICSVDIGVKYKGFHVDAARTFMVGEVESEVQRLIQVTEASFFKAITYAKAGCRLGDIGAALQEYVESNGFSVVRDLYSHGIGRSLHEDPLIPNFGKKGQGLKLKAGMTFALEPMVNMGDFKVLTLPDRWTIIAADRRWSAHYENTVYVSDGEPEVLTI